MNFINKFDFPKNINFLLLILQSDNAGELLRDVSGLRAPTRFRFFSVIIFPFGCSENNCQKSSEKPAMTFETDAHL